MREEMYIPGQDDFPGWDEFYSSRQPSRQRMRYSVKTLLLLPPMLAIVLAMYLAGYHYGNKDQIRLTADLDAAKKALDLAENAAQSEAATAALERRVRDRLAEETRSTMKTLIAVAIDVRVKIAATPGFRDAGNQLLAQIGARLKETAATLHTATGPDIALKTSMAENNALIWSHLDLAEALVIAGGEADDAQAEARRQFEEAQDLAYSIVHFHPGNPQALSDLLVVEARFGDFNRTTGRSEPANENYRDAVAAAAEFNALAPRKALPRRVIAVLQASQGDAHLQSGLALSAADNYQDAIDIMREQATANPRNLEFQRDLVVLYGKLGDAHLLSTDPTQTRDNHQGRFDVSWTILISDRQSGPLRDDYFRFPITADGNRRIDDLTRARDAYQNSMALLQSRPRGTAEPGRIDSALAHGLARLGCLEIAAENYAAAIKSIEEAIATLAGRDSDAADGEKSSAGGEAYKTKNAASMAASVIGGQAFNKAQLRPDGTAANMESSDLSSTNAPDSAASAAIAFADREALASCLKDLREKVAFSRSAIQAIDDPKFIQRQPRSEMPRWLGIRGRAFARSGRAGDATAMADLLAQLEPRRGDNLLEAAEIYAILVLGVNRPARSNGESQANDPKGDPPPVDPAKAAPSQSDESSGLRKLRDGYAARAVELLRDAAERGYPGDVKTPSAVFLANSNLGSLVGRDDFQSLLGGLDVAAAEKAQKKR